MSNFCLRFVQDGQITTDTSGSVPHSLSGHSTNPCPVRPQLSQPTPSPQSCLPTTPPVPEAIVAANTANILDQQMTPDRAKIVCKKILEELLRHTRKQPESVYNVVRALIQGLIDGTVWPEVFPTKLHEVINSPHIFLILQKTMPYLQPRELTIEGLNTPSMQQTGKLSQNMTVPAQAAKSAPTSSPMPMSTQPYSVISQVRTNLPKQSKPETCKEESRHTQEPISGKPSCVRIDVRDMRAMGVQQNSIYSGQPLQKRKLSTEEETDAKNTNEATLKNLLSTKE